MVARSTKYLYFLGVLIMLIQLYGCLTAGTHGSIKAYEYPVSKYVLEEAVGKVIKESSNIHQDTQRNYMVDITDGKSDTIYSDYYNDSKRYITIKVRANDGENEYVFRYGGNKQYWDTSRLSYLSIAYAFDENNRGGSEGDGGVTWYKPFLKKKLVDVFEKEFIEKVDKDLGVKHTIAD